jgi:SAM-dependent methyltransferase
MSFEEHAEAWLRWARTIGHDAYWEYRDAFFEAMLPAAGRRTLEVGCGEGRVARDLARHGHRVVALDVSPTLAASAATADPAGPVHLRRPPDHRRRSLPVPRARRALRHLRQLPRPPPGRGPGQA